MKKIIHKQEIAWIAENLRLFLFFFIGVKQPLHISCKTVRPVLVKYQAPGYSRIVDGAGGRHSTAICSEHRDVACASTFVVAVDELPEVIMLKWMVPTGIYLASDTLSSPVGQHDCHSCL